MLASKQAMRQQAAIRKGSVVSAALLVLAGCAAPGPPRSPTLNLPARARKLTAERLGDQVILHFEAPEQTTDGQGIRTANVEGSLCRSLGSNARCLPVTIHPPPGPAGLFVTVPVGNSEIEWVDRLPGELSHGPPRLLTYEVELQNKDGRSAGRSEPVFAAAGESPAPVEGLAIEGSRLGAALRWLPSPSDGHGTDVLLKRTPSSPRPQNRATPPRQERTGIRHNENRVAEKPKEPGPKPASVWLTTVPAVPEAVDADATDGKPYQYLAVRRQVVKLGNRTLEIRSTPSPELAFQWKAVYPPPMPRDLAAAASSLSPAGSPFGIDLIWRPVTVENLAGYNVYREGADSGKRLLTPEPVRSPGFHDSTAKPGVAYRYSITAVDRAGNESAAASVQITGEAAP